MTTTQAVSSGSDIIGRAAEISRATEAAFGNSTALLHKKRFLIEAILRAGGVTAGGAVTPQVVVALDAANDIAALLNAPMPSDPLASMIATGLNASPLFELYEGAAKKVADAMAMKKAEEEAAAAAAATKAEPEPAAPAKESGEEIERQIHAALGDGVEQREAAQ
ncbi:MAG: hypothetical protein FD152_2747 [Xanthobacteraceae bacterium]|nr:MAG: hypothetical protein FD152_2747 [Xanthobacteraceae bacterium]